MASEEVCAITRCDEDSLLRRAFVECRRDTQIRILAHASCQFYKVNGGAWESVAGSIVGFVAFGRGIENVRLIALSVADQAMLLDIPVSRVTSYTVRCGP
jgi:hypothetical protein